MSKKLSVLFPDKIGTDTSIIQTIDANTDGIDNNLIINGNIQATNIILNTPITSEYIFTSNNTNRNFSNYPTVENTDATLRFNNNNSNEITGSLNLPLTWKEGSNISVDVNLLMSTNGSNSYTYWRFSYKWTNLNSIIDTNFTEIYKLIDVNYLDKYHFKENICTFSGENKLIGSVLAWKLARLGKDSNDTYNQNIKLYSMTLNLEIDKLG